MPFKPTMNSRNQHTKISSLLQRPRILAGLATLLLAALVAPSGVGGAAQDESREHFYLCHIEGSLDEATVALVRRTYRMAQDSGASHVILEINTPGGRIDLMHRILRTIEHAPEITSVAFVDSKAASAGALIAITCDQLFMTPGGNIGSARPIWALPDLPIPGVAQQLKEERSQELEKLVSDFRATFRSKAQAKDRNEDIAEAMVDDLIVLYLVEIEGVPRVVSDDKYRSLVKSHGERKVRQLEVVSQSGSLLNLTAEEAERLQFIDAIIPDLDGVRTLLGLEDAQLIVVTMSWSERFASWVQSLWWVLLIAGLLAVALELYIPGFGVPGIVGVSCFALLLFGKYLVGLAEMTEILLIIAGALLIVIELFLVPGFLVPGIVGGILTLVGVVLCFQTYDLPGTAPPLARSNWWSNFLTLLLTTSGAIIAAFAMSSLVPKLPFASRLMVRQSLNKQSRAAAAIPDDIYRGWTPELGSTGEALTPLRPAGKIRIEGRSLDAVTEGEFVDMGTPVRVLQVQGNRIVVRSIEAD